MATRSRGRCILSPWTPGSLTCPCTTHTRQGFTRSRSPFPAGDKEENINKHTPTISRSLIKIMNTHLTPNLIPSSEQSEEEQSPFPWALELILSLIQQLPGRPTSPPSFTCCPSVPQGQKSIDHLQSKHNISYTSKTFLCNFLESSFPSSVWIDLTHKLHIKGNIKGF